MYCRQLLLLNQGRVFAFGPPEEVLSKENIQQVYHTQVEIYAHPLTGLPQILLLPEEREVTGSRI